MTNHFDPTRPSSDQTPLNDPSRSGAAAEQLSAFLDGELPERETELLLKRVSADTVLRGRAARYLLIGEAARQGTAQVRGASKGFAARVSAALATETERGDLGADQVKTSAPSAPSIPGRVGSPWLRRSAGFAAAASVGALAVLIWQGAQAPEETPLVERQVSGAEAMSSGTFAAVERDVSQAQTSPSVSDTPAAAGEADVAGASGGLSRSIRDSRLTNYVMAHSEYSSPLGRRTMLSGILAADGESQDVRDVAYVEQGEVERARVGRDEMEQDRVEQYR